MRQDNDDKVNFNQWAAERNIQSPKRKPFWRWVLIVIIALAVIQETIHYVYSTKGWAIDDTNVARSLLKTAVSTMAIDTQSREKLIDCALNKLKNKYPQGLIDVNNDSINVALKNFVAACSVETDIKLGWTQTVENVLRSQLMQSFYVRKLSKANQTNFCNCFISNLKIRYPDGIKTMDDSIIDSLKKQCYLTVK